MEGLPVEEVEEVVVVMMVMVVDGWSNGRDDGWYEEEEGR